jgi:hypothetical protein
VTRKTFTATVEATVENAPEGYGNADFADDIRDTTHLAITEDTPLDIVVMQVSGSDAQQKVWVGIVTDDIQSYGKPAIYVAPTEADVIKVVRLQNGVPAEVPDDELGDWFSENKGAAVHWDSYYVETGDE